MRFQNGVHAAQVTPTLFPEPRQHVRIKAQMNRRLAGWRHHHAGGAPEFVVHGTRGRADAFVARMPTDKAGLLFLQADNVVQPDPDQLDTYQTHAGQRRGQWPSSPEIYAAMFERYAKKPSP